MSSIRLRLEGFDGDHVVIGIYGASKYDGRHLYFSPVDFVEFLKFLKKSPVATRTDLLIEISDDSGIEANKKFLR